MSTAVVQRYTQELGNETSFLPGTSDRPIVGQSPALKTVFEQVRIVAQTDANVLILGETGSGKELFAKAIHDLSSRRDCAFVKTNCSAIPTGLLESELFGHERGAFTGAIARRIGRFEAADKGTFFLDEIGDMPLEVQPKLLRAIQEREFERLGTSRSVKVDVRMIAATHRDLSRMVVDREFRSDLFYRLNVFPIRIPSLRERVEDIPLLVHHFLRKFAARMNRQVHTVPAATMRMLQQWHWPGNVRELENFIERSVVLSTGSVLDCPVEQLYSVPTALVSEFSHSDALTMADCTREHILKILRQTHGVMSGPNGAATLLGVKRTTLQARMRKLGISRIDWFADVSRPDQARSAWSVCV